MLLLFQLFGTSPDCHDFSNLEGSALAESSASSLRSYGCTSRHGLVHLQVPWMVSNLVFSYSGRFFILPVPALAVCNLSGVAGALAAED